MKHGLAQMVGRKIATVVLAQNANDPKWRFVLAFSDGSSFELLGENMSCRAGLDPANSIMDNLERSGATVRKVFGNVAATMPVRDTAETETLESLLDRDLTAWRLAKAAIGKAKGTL